MRRMKEIKLEKKEEQSELEEYVAILEGKVEKYSIKIKTLYEDLIKEKKRGRIDG